ncbi:MAG: transcription-repair coupling factor, partial [Candidatus Gastranaerophilales bacterium]|nr:transcription-repair coupling factor [Candidatus Gastranaerophilales bacterium]
SLPSKNHTDMQEFKRMIKKFKKIGFDNFIEDDFFEDENVFSDKIEDFESSMPPSFSSNGEKIADFLNKKIKENAFIFISSAYPNRVNEILKEFEIFNDEIQILPSISQSGGEFKIEGRKIVFLTDKELFNKHSKDITSRKYMYNKQSQDYIESINDIRNGEFVVHYIHGIGIFKGLIQQDFDGSKKDYLEIEFQDKDKLFMPAEQINLLKRYRGTGCAPKLSKMGGAAWENIKNRAKKEVKEIAYDLLKLYARRKMSKGIAFEPDTAWQYEMEEGFEYIETKDQMTAINDTKADMENQKPMDRLICADVGFGKTEVALRAVFKAVMSGYQAAMIAPTTILAMQHYQTLKERFKPFSINIALVSRFKSLKERKKTFEELKNGTCDVVIGTHGLLWNIEYKNLGLLVIDEEHKFGVIHKEKLKKYKENIDILSMSATPIPRTLNMALSGLKDLSLINTPPKNRLPVKTYVGEFNENYIKNAINHELQRDGQVYFVHNRVEDISKIGKYVQDLIPNAKVAVAHGQMREHELERIMFDFLNREYNVLVSTTIVESGLDIPNVNTIIIDNSDRFGLAQLYQLRGRVGRSDRQAYCYCFYKQSKELNEEAIKRLRAIKEFTNLGSGYQIAMRDIEIRGVGNILGAKQHGHMVNVGFDTYCALLEEAIEELKEEGKEKKEKFEPCLVDIKTNAYIPDDWAGSFEQKMLEYKKLADIKTLDELEGTISAFKDRFSKLPEPVENLFKLIRLRLLATSLHIIQIQETKTNIRLYTPFLEHEWNIIRGKLSLNITKYFKWTKPQKTDSRLKGIVLMKNDYLNFNETFNILADLFYHISRLVLNFKSKEK